MLMQRPSSSSHSSGERDRKSTRLNSSHVAISYAVFCLKKKRQQGNGHRVEQRRLVVSNAQFAAVGAEVAGKSTGGGGPALVAGLAARDDSDDRAGDRDR